MRRAGVFLTLLLIVQQSSACPFCNPQIKNAIYDSRFYPNLFAMLSAFIVLAVVIGVLSVLAAKGYNRRVLEYPTGQNLTPVPLLTTATILGIGVGGFVDGIALHQILQWHEMLSAKLPPTNYVFKSVNMFWDGVFHAFTLIVTLIGIVLLWKLFFRNDIDRSGYLLGGSLLLGWGVFNIVEGVIDHHILKLHNMREITNSPEAWNVGFLGLSVLMLIAGYLLTRKAGGDQSFSTVVKQ